MSHVAYRATLFELGLIIFGIYKDLQRTHRFHITDSAIVHQTMQLRGAVNQCQLQRGLASLFVH